MPRTVEDVLKDIEEHPERHRHDFNELTACCIIEGAFVMYLMEAHSKGAPLGRNGGVACDVVSGPCACGAWH
ncbi:MAG: hypothetical protein Q7S32_00155 [bacterium]|nr:hypothetical protein [bacterium]